MPFVPRKVEIAVATIAMAGWAGCTAGSRSREPHWPRELFTTANHRAAVTVIGGVGLFESEGPRPSRFEEFLYGPQVTESRRLRTPQGLATDGRMLWVCDQGYPDVLAILPDHTTFRSATTRARRPATPIAVAVDETLNVFVADATRRSVLSFGNDGGFLQEISPPTPFEPTSLFIRDGVLFIADRANRQIARYDLMAQSWLPPLAPGASQPSFAVPAGLAWGANGDLLVTDALLGVVHRMAPDGTWLAPLGSRGRAEGQLVRPIGICTTPSGLIVVADAARQAVIVFESNGAHLIDIHPQEAQLAAWTLPTGLACLSGHPLLTEPEGRGDSNSGDWIVVSDMLGEFGLTLVHVKIRASTDGAP